MVLVSGGTNPDSPAAIGTPTGPNFEDIIWEEPFPHLHRVWGRFQEDNGRLMISANRPVNGSFNPNARYHYYLYIPR